MTCDPGRARLPDHEGDHWRATRSRRAGVTSAYVALHMPVGHLAGSGLSEIAGFEGERINIREIDVRVLDDAGDATDRQDRAIHLSGTVV